MRTVFSGRLFLKVVATFPVPFLIWRYSFFLLHPLTVADAFGS